jgi:hypothetical protein
MVRRTKKLKGGNFTDLIDSIYAIFSSNKSPDDSKTYTFFRRFFTSPVYFLYWILFQQGAKGVANYKLFKRIIQSYKITRNKYESDYKALDEKQKKDFIYAAILIKSHYHQRIGETFSVIKPAQDIMESCDDIESLDTQIRLMKSKHYKDPGDFNDIFKNKVGKFEELYRGMSDIAKDSIDSNKQSADNKLERDNDRSYLFRSTRKIHRAKDKLTTESDKLDDGIIKLERAQQLIEDLFKIRKPDGKDVNYSYMILFILHDLYDRDSFINSHLKNQLSKIIYSHKSDCRAVNSATTSMRIKYMNPISKYGPYYGKYEVSKKTDVRIPTFQSNKEPEENAVPQVKPAPDANAVPIVKTELPPAAAIRGGYSRRRAPKKRIPTIKRLKVTR